MTKRLIVINGTMGVGKTAVSTHLKQLLPRAVFLDGDWCWDSNPFVVTDETKKMVLNNIAYMLTSFLTCSEYENVIFCWVMNKSGTFEEIQTRIANEEYNTYQFSLVCSSQALERRINADVCLGLRDINAFERSIVRMKDYDSQNSVKLDVSNISAEDAAKMICCMILEGEQI